MKWVRRIGIAVLVMVLSVGLFCAWSFDDCFFFYRFLREPAQTGSVFPTSDRVAQELIEPLLHTSSPRRILEVGAGTGPVTDAIVAVIAPEDHVDVLEIDPQLCALLKDRFADHPEQVNVHCVAAQEWRASMPYDVIITTVPFNNLSPALVDEILTSLEQAIKPGGVISYIEYIGGRQLKRLTSFGKHAKEVQARAEILENFQDRYNMQRVWLLANLPPTYVYHLTSMP